ncbi:MAG: helix-turn-helix domain-containing protein [Lentisphaeria bacterium]
MTLLELLLLVEEVCEVSASVEFYNLEIKSCTNLKLTDDLYMHHYEFCRKMKLSGHSKQCIKNKTRSRFIAQRGRVFCGFCPHGIWEMALPVMDKNALQAIVYLGNGHIAPSSEKWTELLRHGKFIVQFMQLELYRYWQKQPTHVKKREQNFYLESVKRYINEKYDQPISLSTLANELHVNSNYLGKLISKNHGKGFTRLLTEKRMKQSEVLVRLHLKLPFYQIAELCGFPDSNYFSVVFKSCFSFSPRDYRKKCTANTEGH